MDVGTVLCCCCCCMCDHRLPSVEAWPLVTRKAVARQNRSGAFRPFIRRQAKSDAETPLWWNIIGKILHLPASMAPDIPTEFWSPWLVSVKPKQFLGSPMNLPFNGAGFLFTPLRGTFWLLLCGGVLIDEFDGDLGEAMHSIQASGLTRNFQTGCMHHTELTRGEAVFVPPGWIALLLALSPVEGDLGAVPPHLGVLWPVTHLGGLDMVNVACGIEMAANGIVANADIPQWKCLLRLPQFLMALLQDAGEANAK